VPSRPGAAARRHRAAHVRFFLATANPATVWCRTATRRRRGQHRGVGFALTPYPIGVRARLDQRRRRAIGCWRRCVFFSEAAQVPCRGRHRIPGLFLSLPRHGQRLRARRCELSTVTLRWLAGMLFCQSWFDQANDDEARIRSWSTPFMRAWTGPGLAAPAAVALAGCRQTDFQQARLARLRRGDGRLPAGAGGAGARGRRIGVARLVLDVHKSWGT